MLQAVPAVINGGTIRTGLSSLPDSTELLLVSSSGLESTSDLKTVNGESLLGSGNITLDLSSRLAVAANLSDLANVVTARSNLGLGTLATQSGTFSGTSSGTNTGDQDLSGLMVKANNLSDITNAATSRTNLGVYSIAQTDSAIATAVTGLLDDKGPIDCSTNPNYPAASKGDCYHVTVAGKVGGASGVSVDVGDVVACSADNAGGTQAAVGTSWYVLEHNLVGALVASNNLSDITNAVTARTNLGLGTLATQSGTFSGTSSGTNTGDQDLSSYLTSALAASTYLPLAGGTLTGLAQFSGTGHAGLRLNNLTTAQRDTVASPQAGMTLWNTTTSRLNVHNGSAWTTGFIRLDGDTATGLLQFSGTTHAGLRLNNLTTTERDAIVSPTAGMLIWNTTTSRLNRYNGSAWSAGFVAVDGDTMTGALTINLSGSSSNAGLSLTTSGGSHSVDVSANILRLLSYNRSTIINGSTTVFDSKGGDSILASNTPAFPRGVVVQPINASNKLMILRQASSQTANSFELQNSSGNLLLEIPASGALQTYNTYTNSTNYERSYQRWASNILSIGTEKGSGGGTARALRLETDGTAALTIAADRTSLTVADAMHFVLGSTTGTKWGTATTQKQSFWNATPIVQPSGANQGALTDSTGGTAGFTLVDVGMIFSQGNINSNFASVARLLDNIRTVLVNTGLMKGAA